MRKKHSMLAMSISMGLGAFCVIAFAGFNIEHIPIEPITPDIPPSIDRLYEQQQICLNMLHGTIVSTDFPFDLAIGGEGYIVLNDGQQDLYSRGGSFGVNASSYLVDPPTDYIVQRIGTIGESDGFQTPGDIKIRFDAPMPANATTEIKVHGNLSADEVHDITQTNVLRSDLTYTMNGVNARAGTKIIDLDQFNGICFYDSRLYVTGTAPDGTAVTDTVGLNVNENTTMGDVCTYIDIQFGTANVTAWMVNGRIAVTDDSSGYSQTDISLLYTSSDTDILVVPEYFEVVTVGGNQVKSFNIIVYDSQGGEHVLSGAFTRTGINTNLWDLVLTSISGNISELTLDNRRIQGIKFNNYDGSFAGLDTGIGDTAQFTVTFVHDTANPQVISVNMGTQGLFDGLTQFAQPSTAVAKEQDGYVQGDIMSVSVNNKGIISGTFTNGLECDIAVIKMAMFENVCGLLSIGGGYYISTDDSGEAIVTHAKSNGAGRIFDKALEKPVEPNTSIENAIERIKAALEKEWMAYDMLEQMLENGDYGDLKKRDIIKARQKLYSAIQHQEQSLGALEKSIESLEDALEAVDEDLDTLTYLFLE